MLYLYPREPGTPKTAGNTPPNAPPKILPCIPSKAQPIQAIPFNRCLARCINYIREKQPAESYKPIPLSIIKHGYWRPPHKAKGLSPSTAATFSLHHHPPLTAAYASPSGLDSIMRYFACVPRASGLQAR